MGMLHAPTAVASTNAIPQPFKLWLMISPYNPGDGKERIVLPQR